MTKSESENSTDTPNPVVTKPDTVGIYTGWLGILFGCLGIIFLGIVFFPLTILMAGISLLKRNWLLGSISAILAVLVFVTSPTLWGLVALKGIYDKGVQEQTRVNQTAQRVIKTKKQEDKDAVINHKEISNEQQYMSILKPEDRSYAESTQLAISMAQKGGTYLNSCTVQDLKRIVFNPWVSGTIPEIQKQLTKAISTDRKEISKFPAVGSLPNIESINGKYEYTRNGILLVLKSIYLDITVSNNKNILSDTPSDTERETLEKSLSGMESAITLFSSGNTLSEPVPVAMYGKDDKLATKTISIKSFPNGNFGILVNSDSPASTGGTKTPKTVMEVANQESY
ncbi:MAG: hypothetical protein PHQ95_00820 [Candidatus Gracilibacteria bacterium]|nr:hypothetical protein [Candidatus Gracilibacteria bacterium]